MSARDCRQGRLEDSRDRRRLARRADRRHRRRRFGPCGRLFENPDGNAVEHAGRACTVTVTDTPVGFAVCDDGPGTDPADHDTVFDPAFSGTADGTGLGLYVVETIASAHGWTVAVTDGDVADAGDVADDESVAWSEATAPGARFAHTLSPGVSEAGESTPP